MNNDLISLIVPVYNTPIDLFKRCLNSIYSQNYGNLELIIVDDGSSEEYKKIYSTSIINKKKNIKIIEKENTGVSDSRNVGIKKASGKYIMFVDSDDYIDEKYISKMYKSLKENFVDVSISGATIVDINGKKLSTQLCCLDYNKKLTLDDIRSIIINYPFFTCVKMLIKKEIIKNEFNLKIKYGEDLLFAFELLMNNPFVYLNECGYYYVQNSSSATHNFSYEKICKYLNDNLVVFDKIKNNLKNVDEIVKIRLFTKFEIGLNRYILNDNCNYSLFKNLYNEYKLKYNCSKLKYKDIKYLNFVNRIMVLILHKKMLKSYYLLNKIKKIIKRK